MAFIDDNMAVISNQIGDEVSPNQALHESNIDDARRLFLAAMYDADFVWCNV